MGFGALAMLAVVAAPLAVAGVIPIYLAVRRGAVPVAVRAFLTGIPLTYFATVYLYATGTSATRWRAWVGMPLPPEVHAMFLPALLCSAGGLVVLGCGFWRKAPSVTAAGALGIAAGLSEGLFVAAMFGWAEAG